MKNLEPEVNYKLGEFAVTLTKHGVLVITSADMMILTPHSEQSVMMTSSPAVAPKMAYPVNLN